MSWNCRCVSLVIPVTRFSSGLQNYTNTCCPQWGQNVPKKAASATKNCVGHVDMVNILWIKKKPSTFCNADGKKCRSGGIRTRGLLVPNQTRYQTALHLEKRANRGTRTLDLRFTKPLLYRLSHVGTAETIQLY